MAGRWRASRISLAALNRELTVRSGFQGAGIRPVIGGSFDLAGLAKPMPSCPRARTSERLRFTPIGDEDLSEREAACADRRLSCIRRSR